MGDGLKRARAFALATRKKPSRKATATSALTSSVSRGTGDEQRARSAIRIVDLALDGLGPWKLFVGDYGAAVWPVHRDHDSREYAEEVARVIRLGVAVLLTQARADERAAVARPYVAVETSGAMIAGTRIPVRRLWAWFRRGVSVETLLKRYPQLGPARVLGALAYACDNTDRLDAELALERGEHARKAE